MSWRDHPDCPKGEQMLCSIEDVPDEGGFEVSFGSGKEPFRVLLLRQGDSVWAYLNSCPHFSLPLNFNPQEFVTLDGLVMCAHHTAFFKFDDGDCVDGPCAGTGLTAIPIVRRGSQVFLSG